MEHRDAPPASKWPQVPQKTIDKWAELTRNTPHRDFYSIRKYLRENQRDFRALQSTPAQKLSRIVARRLEQIEQHAHSLVDSASVEPHSLSTPQQSHPTSPDEPTAKRPRETVPSESVGMTRESALTRAAATAKLELVFRSYYKSSNDLRRHIRSQLDDKDKSRSSDYKWAKLQGRQPSNAKSSIVNEILTSMMERREVMFSKKRVHVNAPKPPSTGETIASGRAQRPSSEVAMAASEETRRSSGEPAMADQVPHQGRKRHRATYDDLFGKQKQPKYY
ncbi:hypothetical protein IQ07DRAFT_648579 [Pyrenochaeta sp. DS3sAY3a]|nr:hypothetical protein IQ07DRAFT_648579 [Pyrenochaeta sp. DS3sAY3a]